MTKSLFLAEVMMNIGVRSSQTFIFQEEVTEVRDDNITQDRVFELIYYLVITGVIHSTSAFCARCRRK